jgi:hypothetical protein
LKTSTIITTTILALAGVSPASAYCVVNCSQWQIDTDRQMRELQNQREVDFYRQRDEDQRRAADDAQRRWQRSNDAWMRSQGYHPSYND